MKFSYSPKGVCSRQMLIEMTDDDRVASVQIVGGCNGNGKGIASLVAGMPAEEIIRRLEGISCNGKPTSCPGQLAEALKQYLAQK